MEFLELGKSRAELAFKLEILKSQDADSTEAKSADDKLGIVRKKIEDMSAVFQRTVLEIPIPNENEIARLNSALSCCSAREIAESMKNKAGKTYELLSARGAILKHNFENRENIAKLALLLPRFQKDVRAVIANAVRKGRLDDPVQILKSEEVLGRQTAKILGRLGIPAVLKDGALVQSGESDEVPVRVSNRTVWVTCEVNEKLAQNLKRIYELSPKIQLKNAVRYVQKFNDEEEKEYAQMQNDLLRLLKEQDELLREFEEEKNLSLDV